MNHMNHICRSIFLLVILSLVGCNTARTTQEIVDLGALKEIEMNKSYKEAADCALPYLDSDMCFSAVFDKVCPLNRVRYIDSAKESEIVGQYPSGNRFVITIQSTGDATSLAKFYITNGGLLRGTAAEKAIGALSKCN